MIASQNQARFRDVEPLNPAFQDCDFYHTTTLPSGEVVRGQWDLRDNVNAYLGGVELAGKSVLEIGPASGFLSYHMERSGARVTAIEPSLERLWDCVPMPGIDFAAWRQSFHASIQRVRNSFWYLHHQYGSSTRVVEADPETLPAEVGEFDVGVFASVLLHCRSPFSVLEGCVAQVRETVIVTDLHDSILDEQPVCRLLPDVQHKQIDTWWALSPTFIVQALGVLGFGDAKVTSHHQKRDIDGQMIPLFTVVAKRNVPMSPRREVVQSEAFVAPERKSTHIAQAHSTVQPFRSEIAQRTWPSERPEVMPPTGSNVDLVQELLSPSWDGLLCVPQRLGKPSGWWGHVPFASWVVQACQPAMLVELGTHHGVSYSAFCEAVLRLGLLSRCFAVDHWRGDRHSGIYDDSVYEDLKRFNDQRYGAFSELIRSDFGAAAEGFAAGSIDLLHIDGLHTYEAVLRDFQTWLPKLSQRGVVLFHDTNVYRDEFGVHRVFRELSKQYPSFEFLHGNGLGVLACGTEAPAAIARLCHLDGPRQILAVRERFARLGFNCELQAREYLQAPHLEKDRTVAAPVKAPEPVAAQNIPLAELRDARAQVEKLERQLDALRQSVAQVHKANDMRVAAAEKQSAQSESEAREFKRERDMLMQSLYDLQADLAAQQQRHQQQTRIYDQVLTDLLRRHAEEVDFLSQQQHVPRNSAIPHLLAWFRRQLPVSLPPMLQFARPQLHKLLIEINPVAKVVARSTFFDQDWYRAQYPDVAKLGAHPAYHYTVVGARDGFDPGPWFSTRRYLALHPELVKAGVNPLYHFELEGRKSGRPLDLGSGITASQNQGSSPAVLLAENKARMVADNMLAQDDKARHVQQAQLELQTFLGDPENQLVFPSQSDPVVSIVLVLFNHAALTLRCLKSIHEQLPFSFEVIVVDNASTDESGLLLERLVGCTVARQQENLHFLRAANLGAKLARGRHLLFLNNDTTLCGQALAAASTILDRDSSVGAVGGQILLLDGTLQEAGAMVWKDGSTSGYGRGADPMDAAYQFQRDVDYCSGAFLMVQRVLFDQLGGFDPVYAPAYYEDVDLCARIWEAGSRVVYSPQVQIIHVESASYGADGSTNKYIVNNRERFKLRHVDRLQRAWARQATDDLFARLALGRYPARVLFVDDLWPVTNLGSGFPRAREFVAALCQTGVFITHYATNLDNASFTKGNQDPLGLTVERITGGLNQLATFLLARSGYYDCLIVSRPHNMQAVSTWMNQYPDAAIGLRVIYDAEAIVSSRALLLSQVKPGVPAPTMNLRDEISLTRQAHTILAVNETEAEMFRNAGRVDVRVLGHCVDVDLGLAPFASRTGILFVGRLAEMDSPNVDAVEWFIEAIMPLLDRQMGSNYTVDLVGLCADALRHRYAHHERLRWHGQVDDLTTFYANARIFIAPARFAAGVPIKVYEAAARGVPVVATTLLGRQLGWVDRQDILLADSPSEFAHACATLYHDAQLWDAIRDAAMQRVHAECGRPAFGREVHGLLEGLLAKSDEIHPAAENLTRAVYSLEWNKTAEEWSLPPDERSQVHGMFWMVHPLVAQRLNRKISGDPTVGTYAYLKRMLQQQGLQLPVRRAASLGSGFGGLEHELIALDIAQHIDGFDLADKAVASAQQTAHNAGLSDRLHYRVCNLEQVQLSPQTYDLVVASHSVHHIDDLDRLFSQVKLALKPGGIFCLDEYVGPNRFQWSALQLEAVNEFLRQLPARYKRMPSGEIRGEAFRPAVADVIAVDPTEAVRSADIVSALRRHFTIISLRELGGSLLHNALYGIAQNFNPAVAEDRHWMESLFALEDRMMDAGELGSDFAVIIAVKNKP